MTEAEKLKWDTLTGKFSDQVAHEFVGFDPDEVKATVNAMLSRYIGRPLTPAIARIMIFQLQRIIRDLHNRGHRVVGGMDFNHMQNGELNVWVGLPDDPGRPDWLKYPIQ